ncbi:hypothetical protein C8Q75DRAFT_555543 [Abortiporus biennis]|nr:hypothetical protein C8Q75DRAFT_555543 [Abortiporus biennis]
MSSRTSKPPPFPAVCQLIILTFLPCTSTRTFSQPTFVHHQALLFFRRSAMLENSTYAGIVFLRGQDSGSGRCFVADKSPSPPEYINLITFQVLELCPVPDSTLLRSSWHLLHTDCSISSLS